MKNAVWTDAPFEAISGSTDLSTFASAFISISVIAVACSA